MQIETKDDKHYRLSLRLTNIISALKNCFYDIRANWENFYILLDLSAIDNNILYVIASRLRSHFHVVVDDFIFVIQTQANQFKWKMNCISGKIVLFVRCTKQHSGLDSVVIQIEKSYHRLKLIGFDYILCFPKCSNR